MLNKHDMDVLRPLIQRYAEIAALPIQGVKRELWRDNNEHRSARPMVLIDQICWNELNADGGLNEQCEDPYWRGVESELRKKIYCWEHMPVDMVFNPYISLPKPLHNTGWGLKADFDQRTQQADESLFSYSFHNVLEEEEDVEKIQMPEITLDEQKLREIQQEADILCQGIIPYRMQGETLHLGVWDRISEWMGVQNCYIELIDRPEFLHAIMERLTQGLLHQIDTLNRLKAYDVTGNITHCSHTFTDNLPGKDCDLDHGTTQQGWAFGLAQLFTACSPDVTAEFEVPYMNRVFPHFGAIYYGCCERLDDRLDVIAKLKNVRKISCSPWSHKEHFAERMPDYCVMSAKPTPALLATESFDEDAVRKDLRETIDAAKRYNRNLEFLLKDISTIHNDPKRLWRWAEIAMEEVQR